MFVFLYDTCELVLVVTTLQSGPEYWIQTLSSPALLQCKAN